MNSLKDRLRGLRSYPYTNARVRAMRGLLITDGEYRKLAKMQESGIAEFLAKRGYGDEIDALSGEFTGTDLIEKALQQNLSATYLKLIRIAPDTVDELLWTYFRKFDIQNLKLILRKTLRDTSDDITPMLIETPHTDKSELERYLEMDSVDAILNEFTIPGFEQNLANLVAETDNLPAIEDALDRYYYEHISQIASSAPVGSKLFKQFLAIEAGVKNITLVLRMKRRGYDAAAIRERLIDVDHGLDVAMDDLVNAETYEDALEELRSSTAGRYIESDSPAEVSRALERYKLEKGIQMLHRDQLSVNPILGYMICKEIEVSNLRMIARAKEEDLGEDFITRNLITGVAT